MADVYFRKPDFKKLAREGKTVVDMHYHTKYSADSIATPRLIMKKAKRLGIGVAVTDHNTINGAREMWKYRKEMFIIPGIEITDSTCLHSIVYFYSFNDLEEFFIKKVKPHYNGMPFYISKDLNYILESAKEYNSVACIPHPFSPGALNINTIDWNKEMIDNVDLVEVINAFNLRARNLIALNFANKVKKGMTGGSDGHSIGELGGAVSVAEGDERDSFFSSLLAKKSMVIGRESNVVSKAVQSIIKEGVMTKRNIVSHNQMKRLKSIIHANKKNVYLKVNGSKQVVSRILHRKK